MPVRNRERQLRVTGVAASPYFGTFEERGSITSSRGVVTGFKAVFWLAATNTKTVSLRKTFVSSLKTATLILDPPGISPPVVPGQGCGDENHLHEDAALCALPDAIDETPPQ